MSRRVIVWREKGFRIFEGDKPYVYKTFRHTYTAQRKLWTPGPVRTRFVADLNKKAALQGQIKRFRYSGTDWRGLNAEEVYNDTSAQLDPITIALIVSVVIAVLVAAFKFTYEAGRNAGRRDVINNIDEYIANTDNHKGDGDMEQPPEDNTDSGSNDGNSVGAPPKATRQAILLGGSLMMLFGLMLGGYLYLKDKRRLKTKPDIQRRIER